MYALSRTSDPWSARQVRQLSYLAEHTTDIRHIAGEENVVADTPSRPPSLEVALPATAWQEGKPEFPPYSPTAQPAVCAVPAFPDMLDFAAIAEHQRSCQVMLQASKSSSLQLRAFEVMGASLLCDFSTGVPRPLIPVVDRQKVFNAFHSLAHAGTRATCLLIVAMAVWRGMNSDVAAWVRDCQACCRGKVTAKPAAPVQPIGVQATVSATSISTWWDHCL
jgi:hypothetical protein